MIPPIPFALLSAARFFLGPDAELEFRRVPDLGPFAGYGYIAQARIGELVYDSSGTSYTDALRRLLAREDLPRIALFPFPLEIPRRTA